MRKLTSEEFIKQAKKVHGDRYNYSKVEYKNSYTKVKIICSQHGEFKQTPANHIHYKKGCYECGKLSRIEKINSNTNEFIEKAELVHNNKYDYSLVEYKHSMKKVCIICPIHGEFWQTPNMHLTGRGCFKCGDLSSMINNHFNSGKYIPKYPEKYSGDLNNIIYRSSYELKAFEMIEEKISKSDFIVSWSSEDIELSYENNSVDHIYIVDLKLETKNGIYLIEIKPEIQTRPPEKETIYYNSDIYHKNMKKWMAAKDYCLKRGWKFQLWTERVLGL